MTSSQASNPSQIRSHDDSQTLLAITEPIKGEKEPSDQEKKMSLSDEHSLESAKDQGLSAENNEISSAAIEKQLVTGKTRVLWNFVHGREQMPLSGENDTDKDSRMKPILPSTQGQESMWPSIHVDQSIQKPLPLSVTLPDPFTEIESVCKTEPISLTFDDYKQQRKQWIHFLWLELKQAHTDDLYALLSKPPYDYSETIAEKFAEDLLEPDCEGSISHNPPTGSECDGTDLTERRQRFQGTVVEQLLLLRFPLNEVSNDQTHILSLDEDDKSREQQNRGFVTMYGGSPRVCHKRIDNRDELFYCIRSYLREDCISTCLATIVINGHGSKRGLRVNSDDNDIPLTDIINSVQDSMDAITTRVGSIQMPCAVDIIFAQCYGYMHGYTENPRELINVVSLTSSKKPLTYQNIYRTQSINYDLESYREKRKMLQRQALQSNFTVQVAAPQEDITTSLQGATGGQESNTTVQAASQEDTTTSLQGATGGQESNTTVQVAVSQEDTTTSQQGATGGQESNTTVQVAVSQEDTTTSQQGATGNNSSDSIPEVHADFLSSLHLSEEIPRRSHDDELSVLLEPRERFTPNYQPGASLLPNVAFASVEMPSLELLPDEHGLESVEDEGLPPESNEISSATIDKQLVTGKTTLVWYRVHGSGKMPLSEETDTQTEPYEDKSKPTSMTPMSEVVPTTPEQNQESLSSIGQSIPLFISATEPLPYETKHISLTFDEFRQWRKQRFENLWLEFKQECIDELSELLSKPPYDYSERVARKYAEDFLNPDFNITCNPDHEPGSECDEPDLAYYRNKLQRTAQEKLLMLRFPLDRVSKATRDRRLSLDEDNKSRKQQNRGFVQMYGGRPRVCHKRIDNRIKLFQCIRSYLRSACSEICLATIVFNGHGSEAGLCVHSGGKVPLPDITKAVECTMDVIKNRRARASDRARRICFLGAVDIVFAQCFGHMHGRSEDPKKLINIISLTSKMKPKSKSVYRSSEASDHYDLMSFADKRIESQQQAQASNYPVQETVRQADSTNRSQDATGGHG